MKIAVTGASGFVGQHLCQFLHTRGDQVLGLVRTTAATPITAAYSAHPVHNFTDTDELAAALRGCDAVIHLIARTHQRHEADTPATRALYFATNTEISRAVAQAAAQAGVRRLVFLSSIKVLGEATTTPFDLLSPPAPLDLYGHSKLEAENCIQQYCDTHAMEWVILRPPLVYASDARGNLQSLRQAIRRHIPLPFAAIRNRRSIISIERLCHYLRESCTEPAACGQKIPLADPQPLSTAALARKIGADIGASALLLPVPVPLLHLIGKALGKSDAIRRLTGDLEVDAACLNRIFRNSYPDA